MQKNIMEEQNIVSKYYLKVTILLLIGFIIGFSSRTLLMSESVSIKKSVQNESASSTASLKSLKEGTTSANSGLRSLSNGQTGSLQTLAISGLVTNNIESGSSSVAVGDQKAGSEVDISNVKVEKETWVVIREDNGLGELGNILGASLFWSGTYNDGKVALLRPTEAGKNYYAVLYTDDGDRIFDFGKDQLLKGENNEVLMVKFRAK
jgi:hypothetical protein